MASCEAMDFSPQVCNYNFLTSGPVNTGPETLKPYCRTREQRFAEATEKRRKKSHRVRNPGSPRVGRKRTRKQRAGTEVQRYARRTKLESQARLRTEFLVGAGDLGEEGAEFAGV